MLDIPANEWNAFKACIKMCKHCVHINDYYIEGMPCKRIKIYQTSVVLYNSCITSTFEIHHVLYAKASNIF